MIIEKIEIMQPRFEFKMGMTQGELETLISALEMMTEMDAQELADNPIALEMDKLLQQMRACLG